MSLKIFESTELGPSRHLRNDLELGIGVVGTAGPGLLLGVNIVTVRSHLDSLTHILLTWTTPCTQGPCPDNSADLLRTTWWIFWGESI